MCELQECVALSGAKSRRSGGRIEPHRKCPRAERHQRKSHDHHVYQIVPVTDERPAGAPNGGAGWSRSPAPLMWTTRTRASCTDAAVQARLTPATRQRCRREPLDALQAHACNVDRGLCSKRDFAGRFRGIRSGCSNPLA